MDLRHTTSSLGGALPGYGLTRSSARERAAVERAVTADTHIRQRPMPVVVVTALVALVGLGIWCWQLYTAISEEGPLTTLFWAGLAMCAALGIDIRKEGHSFDALITSRITLIFR